VLLDILGDVLPRQLAAARAVVSALATELVGTGDAAPEETNL
jgi:predicted outer membrane lipoprotein